MLAVPSLEDVRAVLNSRAAAHDSCSSSHNRRPTHLHMHLQVKGIVGTLVEVLATPSAEVQRAVAACLPPLMPTVKIDPNFTRSLVADLLQQLLHGQTYGARCGPHCALCR